MRLIDADKCPCIQCEDTRNAHCTYEHRSCKKFCDWLNATAYDVEKVVAELSEKSGTVRNMFGGSTRAIGLRTAIDIVKAGGVE